MECGQWEAHVEPRHWLSPTRPGACSATIQPANNLTRRLQRLLEQYGQEWSLCLYALCRAQAIAYNTERVSPIAAPRPPLVAAHERAPAWPRHLALTARTIGEWMAEADTATDTGILTPAGTSKAMADTAVTASE